MEQRDKDIDDLEKYINNLNNKLKIINKKSLIEIKDPILAEPTERQQFKNILLQDIEPEFKDFSWAYNGRISNVKIDKQQQFEIISNVDKSSHITDNDAKIKEVPDLPKNYTELSQNFNRLEKLALYEYAIENTVSREELEIVVPVKTEENVEKKMTMVEIVAMKRDNKRRRKKYRVTKDPPITYTEDIRRLIALQMEALTDYHSANNNIKKRNKDKDSYQYSRDKHFHRQYNNDRHSQGRNNNYRNTDRKHDDYNSSRYPHESTYNRNKSGNRSHEYLPKTKKYEKTDDFKSTSSMSGDHKDIKKRSRSREKSGHKHKTKDKEKHRSSSRAKKSSHHHHKSHKKKSKKRHKHDVDSD